MPGVADLSERGHQHPLEEHHHVRALGDELVAHPPRARLVPGDERCVQPFVLAVESLVGGWTAHRRRSQLGLHVREVAPGDAVPAADDVRGQAPVANPSVGRLVVHAELVGSFVEA